MILRTLSLLGACALTASAAQHRPPPLAEKPSAPRSAFFVPAHDVRRGHLASLKAAPPMDNACFAPLALVRPAQPAINSEANEHPCPSHRPA